MKLLTFCIALIPLLLAAGCSKGVRYSQDEIRDYPVTIQDRIKRNEVTTGMSKIHVRYSWGGPNEVNTLPPGDGGKERVEWIYKKLGFFKTSLIFTDGILTQIITNEPGISK